MGVILITRYDARIQRYLRSSQCLPPAVLVFVLSTILFIIVGCGNSNRPEIASITFTTDSSGTEPVCTTAVTPSTPVNTPVCTAALLPTLVAGGQAVHIFANVEEDNQLLGVSWAVSCGSEAPVASGTIDTSCGTLQPAQTLSGPVPLYPATGIVTNYNPPSALPKGGTVTIIAHATSLPSVTSSVTLNIVAAKSSIEPSQGEMNASLAAKRAKPAVANGDSPMMQAPGM